MFSYRGVPFGFHIYCFAGISVHDREEFPHAADARTCNPHSFTWSVSLECRIAFGRACVNATFKVASGSFSPCSHLIPAELMCMCAFFRYVDSLFDGADFLREMVVDVLPLISPSASMKLMASSAAGLMSFLSVYLSSPLSNSV